MKSWMAYTAEEGRGGEGGREREGERQTEYIGRERTEKGIGRY